MTLQQQADLALLRPCAIIFAGGLVSVLVHTASDLHVGLVDKGSSDTLKLSCVLTGTRTDGWLTKQVRTAYDI